MSDEASSKQAVTALALLCGMLGGTASALADEEQSEQLMFLEYLGSWGESDEDWLLFTDGDDDEDSEEIDADALPDAEKRVEVDDEI